MLTRSLLFRIAGPTLFVSLLFLGSCITAAVYLHHQQSASVRVLDEAIASRRIAGDLLKALDDLAALPVDRRDEAGALHGHDPGLLAQARRGVDKPEEARLVGRLEDSFGRYLRREAQAASGPAPGTRDERPSAPWRRRSCRPAASWSGSTPRRSSAPRPSSIGRSRGWRGGWPGWAPSGRSPGC